MNQPPCFTCKARPAEGNSAYCSSCQPRDATAQPHGSQCYCSACGRLLATLTDFDRSQERSDGVFTGRCLDPAPLGLELAAGAWGTPEGNANRARLADLMRRRAPLPANLTA
jgi:hypothetical protein